MTCPFQRHPLALAALAGSLLLVPTLSHAGAFQLNETSASGLGTAYASGAAAAQDASAMWFNAAALSRMAKRQAAAAIHLVRPSIKFSNDGSTPAAQQPLGGDGGDAGGINVVPNAYLAWPIDSRWAVGLGVTAPWGLVTDYGEGWAGRFQADKSDIKTLNINPAVSWKPAAGVAVGLGLNAQRIQATFTNDVNYSGALLSAAAVAGVAPGSPTFNAIAAATPGLASQAVIKGSDNAFGWNAGVLWDLTPQHRMGVSYRSAIRYHVSGTARFTNPSVSVAGPLGPTVSALAAGVNAQALNDTAVRSDIKLPASANLSYFGSVGGQWDILADLQWTGWSSIQNLTFVRADGSVLQNTPENFRDTYKLAVGFNHRPGGAWMWRGGLAFDQTPVRDAFRTPRLPDADRTWLSAGGQYRASPDWRIDFGAAYLWVRSPSIDADGGSAAGRLRGHYKSNVVILAAQATYEF
jgi:long-chain fatty acid transport protein